MSISAPTSSGAWDCCSTRRNSRACERHGSGACAGRFNTLLDRPTSRVTDSIFSHTLPFADSAAFQLYADFEHAVYPRCRHRQLAPPCGAQG
jgi:hypothetical protein